MMLMLFTTKEIILGLGCWGFFCFPWESPNCRRSRDWEIRTLKKFNYFLVIFYHPTYLWILPCWVVKKPSISILHFAVKVEWAIVKEGTRLMKGWLWSKKKGYHGDTENRFLHPSCQIIVWSPLLCPEWNKWHRFSWSHQAFRLRAPDLQQNQETKSAFNLQGQCGLWVLQL